MKKFRPDVDGVGEGMMKVGRDKVMILLPEGVAAFLYKCTEIFGFEK